VSDLPYPSWIILLAAGALIFATLRGVATGSALLFYRTYKRADNPVLYWFAITLSGVLGIGCLIIAVSALI